MNKLFLHLGTPKTGTTAVQFFMHNNRERLDALGYDYPDLGADFPKDRGFTTVNNDESAYANGNFIMDAQILTAYRQGPEAFETILRYVFPDMAEYYRDVIVNNETDFDTLIAYIRDKLQKSHVILSSENLWTFRYDFLRRFAREFGDRIQVIVYLRRQDHYVESMWNEVVKLGVVTDSVEEYLSFMLLEENDNHGLHYRARLEEIASIIGRERIDVRLYESGALQRSGGIQQDFLRAVGIDPAQQEWVTLKRDVNERISGPAVNVKRVFNEYLQQKVGGKEEILDRVHAHIQKYNEIFYRLGSAYSRNQSGKDAYFSSSERMRMKKLFARDNAYIAENFLGRKPGEPLFEDDDWTADRNVHPLTANEETILRLFFEVCYNS